MTRPFLQDSAFRYTESGQSSLHYLAAELELPVSNRAQKVYEHWSEDLTTVRRVTTSGQGVRDLTARVRHDGSPESLEAFLAAGMRGASIEYFPSLANPSLSFPCVLVTHDEIAPDPALSWTFGANVRLRRTDGGTWQSLLEEPLLYWRAGMSFAGLTFARTGVAYYTNELGLLVQAATGIARYTWLDLDGDGVQETPAYLGEAARTNLVTSDDFTAWSVFGTPIVTGSIDDPTGGTGAYTIEDDDGAGSERVFRSITFTGDGTKSAMWVVRERTAPATGDLRLSVWDGTAFANRLVLTVEWVAGEPSVTPVVGTFFAAYPVGAGYWAIVGQTTSVTAANAHEVHVWPSSDDSDTASIDVWRVNVFDDALPSHSILNASQARNADTLYLPYMHRQQPKTVLIDFVERGSGFFASGSFGGALDIGGSGGGGARLTIFCSGAQQGRYTFAHSDGVGSATATIAAPDAVAIGNRVRLLCHFDYNEDSDGDVRISQRVGSGAETTPVTAAGLGYTVGSPYAQERAYVGSTSAASEIGMNPTLSVKVWPGIKSRSFMEAA